MISPPSAGPMIIVTWYIPKLNDSALRRCSGSTSVGTIDVRATRSTADAPAPSPASTYSAASGGEPATASAARAPATSASAICTSSSSLRRSVRSATAAEQRGGHQRDELDDADGARGQRRARLDVDLVGQRDEPDLRPDARRDPADLEQAEVARLPQRRGVDRDPAEAAANRQQGVPSYGHFVRGSLESWWKAANLPTTIPAVARKISAMPSATKPLIFVACPAMAIRTPSP